MNSHNTSMSRQNKILCVFRQNMLCKKKSRQKNNRLGKIISRRRACIQNRNCLNMLCKKNIFPLNISFGANTHDGNERYMEDFVVAQENNNVVVFAIFDGHKGDDVSKMCAQMLPSVINLPNKKIIPALDDIAVKSNLKGGSTALVIIINKKKKIIQVSRVGDSEAIYFSLKEGSTFKDCKELAKCNHAPDSLDEFNRLKRDFPGKEFNLVYANTRCIKPQKPAFVQDETGKWITNPEGGHNIADVNGGWGSYFEDDNGIGRATTRSVGNIAFKKIGMISTPSTEKIQINAGDNGVIVMGSDGLFDGFKREEIYAIVTHPDLVGNGPAASQALLEAALSTTQKRFGSFVVDNISVIVNYVKAENNA